MTRRMWQDMTSRDFKDRFPKISKYVSYICRKYGLLKRTVNSIRFDVQGRMKAQMEGKKTEREQLLEKIAVTEEKIIKIRAELDRLKPKAAKNSLTDKEKKTYHNLKESLYWKKNRRNRLKQRKEKLDYQIRENVYDMCHGTKVLFNKQYRLMENGYRTHEKWHHDFVKARDRNVFFLGSRDESFGNQMCRLRYDEVTETFTLELRKEYKYCEGSRARDRYVRVGGLDFKHRKAELSALVKSYGTAGIPAHSRFPLSCRFHRVGNRWYLQVIFEQSFEDWRSTGRYGTIGLDYNDGFIELSETDESGNLKYRKHYDLKHHGTGNRAREEIRAAVADIVTYAESKGKDVVIEDLDFGRKKARQTSSNKRKGKAYNRMLHLFDYHRYRQTLENAGFNHRVKVLVVSPRNTSRIGKQKYSSSRKLNVHQAASYVIARRGQGYIDKLTV